MHRVQPRLVAADTARVWPVVAAGAWAVAIRLPVVGEPVFRWGWVPVTAVMSADLARRHLPVPVLRRFGLLAVWWGWAAVTLLWSPDPAAGLWLLAGVGTLLVSGLWAGTVGPPLRALFWAASAAVVAVGFAVLAVPDPRPVGHLNPDRIGAMTVVGLVVVGWLGTVRRWEALVLAVAGLAVTVGTGSRMASVALVVVTLVSPALRLPRRGRMLVAAVVGTAVILAAGTVAFQQRWFSSGRGTLVGLVTGEDTLNTSGRAEVWPQIAAACTNRWVGDGAGASSAYGAAVNPGFPEPHNEFLRVWCDTGLVGVVLFGGFVVAVAEAWWRERSRRSAGAVVAVLSLLLLAGTDNPFTTLGVVVTVGPVLGWATEP